ncbi:uncharacterized protein [Euwallacea fornicatus]|uniref:uncharacterized protein n=1 Tax=Euwallacea fornicatus TaxID=995702 RepID=UPI00338EC6E8
MALHLGDANYERLYQILSSVIPPEKWEYVTLELDRTQRRTTRLMSEIYYGRLINKDTGESTHIIIKIVPSFSLISNFEQIYKNEICFYSRIFPAMNKFQKSKGIKNSFHNIPNYLGGHSLAEKECIIMENIGAAGYEILDRNIELIDSKYLKSIFKVYARMHALSFVFKYEHPEEFKTLTDELVDILKVFNTQGLDKPMESAYLAAIEAFNPEFEAETIKKLKEIKNVRDILGNARDCKGDYKCLTHGNCLIRNMLFKPPNDGGEDLQVKLIDFHLAYVSTPVHDLSYFFYSGASKEDMDKIDDYLELYYDTFSSFVKELGADPQEIYPYRVLQEDWKRYSLLGIFMGITASAGFLLKNSDLSEMFEKSHLPKESRKEIWRQKWMEIYKENAFKERAREICLHAVNYGIL